MRRPTHEQDHRGQGCGRCENRIFEHAETEDTRPRLARIQTGCLEGLPVDDEAAADHERAEAGGDNRTRAPEAKPGPAL